MSGSTAVARSIRPLVGSGRIRARSDVTRPLQSASWLGGRVVFDRRRWDCDETEIAWQAPFDLLILTEAGGTDRTSVRVGGSPAFEGSDRPGALTFVPAGTERISRYRGAALTYGAIWIDPSIHAGSEGCRGLPAPAPLINGEDRVIATLLRSLGEALAEGEDPGPAYVEHLVAMATLRLVARGSLRARRPTGSALGRPAVDRVRAFIEARLDSAIGLGELAALLDLPPDTFARRFRAATGTAPYAYVIERRIARARALLATTDMPIAAVASAVGFSGQSHLTTAFRRSVGTTPRVYRQRAFS